MVVGLGGAPAVVTVSGPASGWHPAAVAIVVSTGGAPVRWGMPSPSRAAQTASPRTAGRQTCRPATAVTAQVVHQPLQWNIGSVHRYRVRWSNPECTISPSAFRYAPRWLYITPFGRPVVPEV